MGYVTTTYPFLFRVIYSVCNERMIKMNFILTTLSVTLGIMLSSILMVLVVTRPKVLTWYSKLMITSLNSMSEKLDNMGENQ